MPQTANPLAALWSKAPAKPVSPKPSAGEDAAAGAQGLDTAPKTPATADHQREVSPYHEQENRATEHTMPGAKVQMLFPA
jgi:hypothetical protein